MLEVGGKRGIPTRAWKAGDREFLGLVSFSHGLQHVYAAVLPITYPLVVAEFHASYTVLGLVLGLASFLGGFLQGATGILERFSSRAIFATQNLLSAAVTVVAGLSPSFAWFAAARLAGSVITSPQHPIGSAVLSTRFPSRRGMVLSLHTTAGSLGTLVVPLLASLLIGAWGWRAALFAFAIPVGAGGLLMAWRLREDRAPGARMPGGGWALALRSNVLKGWPLTLIVASTVAAGGRGLGVVNAYVPAYLKSGLGLPQLTVGAVFTVLLAGGVAGPLLVGWLSDRLPRRPVTVGSYLLGGAALAAFGSSGPRLVALLFTGVLVGALAYAESPLLQSMFAEAVDAAVQRAAFAVYFAISYGAGSLWVAVLGSVIDRAGFSAAYLVMAGSFFVAAGLLAFGGRPHRAPPEGA